jgi:hypothetical protein
MEKASAKKTFTVYVKLRCFVVWFQMERLNLNVNNVLVEEDFHDFIVCELHSS